MRAKGVSLFKFILIMLHLICLLQLLSKSGTRLLEPIMAMQIVAPNERISGIIADLSRRRALIKDVVPKGDRNKVSL